MSNFYFFVILMGISFSTFAQDISGIWKTVDDKTGNPKGLVEIKKTANHRYTGTIIKLFSPVGFEAVSICQNCPAPYTNQPIVGIEILKNLQYNTKTDSYEQGIVLDPLNGKLYSGQAKLRGNGKRLHLRGYVGMSVLGRNQIWIRQD